MTQEQCKEKFDRLKNALGQMLDCYYEAAMESGAIHMEQYEDDFLLPKIILSSALKDMERQVTPLHKHHQKEAMNLYACTYADYTNVEI